VIYALILMLKTRVPYVSGDRYDVPEPTAEAFIASGDAEIVGIPPQSIDGIAVPEAELTACRDRLLHLTPPEPIHEELLETP
jgi:hypothetical protein